MDVLSILKDRELVKPDELTVIEAEVKGGSALEAVLERHGVSQEDMLKALGEHYHMPFKMLPATNPVDKEAIQFVPEESAKHYRFVPIAIKDGALEVGITDPDDIEAQDALQFISSRVGMPYKLFLISQTDLKKVLDEYESFTGVVDEALEELADSPVGGVSKAEQEKSDEGEGDSTTTIKADAPVTKIVATVLRYAVEGGASDIHIEPTPEKTRVRFRMDGDLHTSLELPAKVHPAVVARIKILAKIRLDEKRKPQDGRFSATVEGKRIDFRVSTFPTHNGEKVVMRILDRSRAIASLDTIGLSERDLAIIRDVIRQPYGIILISGPTGSGKSTTLFSMLSEVDRETMNVVSVEDPVEYEIPGVAQSQVFPEIGYTFASGLRSILRQDPDVIMVGEIRDKETAQLAIQAALTGHLVFSTIHTNTAAGVIPRLVDMGVDPYLIAPTLIAAIGQRLVRKLCPGAGTAEPVSESMQVYLDKEFSDLPEEFKKDLPKFEKVYHASSTPDCPNGTRGRLAVFEILKVTDELEHIILTEPFEEKVFAAARAQGMLTMREDAIMKAFSGAIPFEEVQTLGGELLEDEEAQAPIAETAS